MKIPGTHKHASIASIPTSKEFKEGWERTFGKKPKAEPEEEKPAEKPRGRK